MVVGVETVTSFFIGGGEGQNYIRHSHLVSGSLELLHFNEQTAHIAGSSGIFDVLICLSIPTKLQDLQALRPLPMPGETQCPRAPCR